MADDEVVKRCKEVFGDRFQGIVPGKLEPCPICAGGTNGGAALVIVQTSAFAPYFFVLCTECNRRCVETSTADKAVQLWNASVASVCDN